MTKRSFEGVREAFLGALTLAAVSTLGDWIWTHYLRDGAVLPGIIHGAVIFLILAAILGYAAGTDSARRRLLPTLPLAGMGIAAVFYPIAKAVGYLAALLISWVLMWSCTAALQRWARGGHEPVSRTLLRGLGAAIFSGLAFWAISGIWTQPSPGGPNYPWHFLCWAFAFLPGLLALLVHPSDDPAS